MPRKAKIISTEYPFHISARCRNKEYFPLPIEEVWNIMEDYLFFISFAYGVEILSFVLMSNHFHMIIRSPKGNLSEAMNYFMSSTSREINSSAKIINQLYGGRFHQTLIDNNHYLFHVYKYVYRNPVEAGLCRHAEDYPFSTLFRSLGKAPLNFPFSVDSILYESVDRTLRWINQTPCAEDHELIRRSLKKEKFQLPGRALKSEKKPRIETELY